MRAVVKNTFVTLVDAEDLEDPHAARGDARGRARSAGPTVARSGQGEAWHISEGKAAQESLEKLNDLLKRQTGQQVNAPTADSDNEHKGPSVQELRHLQQRLSEMTKSSPPMKPMGMGGKRILSNSSVSTMGSDCEVQERNLMPSTMGMRKAQSSGSVSSMASDMFFEDFVPLEELGGAGFGPIFQKTYSIPEEASQGPQALHGQSWHCQGRVASSRDGTKAEFCHNLVPKNTNLAEEFAKSKLEGPPTTMMIRNIPNRYTQRELIKEMDGMGFEDTYDFFYLPIDKGTLCNVGYAFVNFIAPGHAQRCMEGFDNYTFKKYRKARGKIATVSVAHLQGLEANARHYQNSAVNGAPRIKERRGPIIMSPGTSHFIHN
mmetsp:Transcript_37493/g.60435  ORF Transcript_37493/g.60435 Transcript_37493/m.60435 type:complete len:376 (+) Transcript_37493:153-1280(+)